MNKICLFLIGVFVLILSISFISASDILVWQGQYYTGTTFNTGTYEFNFSVYDSLTGGNICYSNTTNLTTGNFGEWKTEQYNVSSSCNNVSKDYYLNINIDGIDQTPRKRLVVWSFLRKDVNESTLGEIQASGQVISPIIQASNLISAPIINATQVQVHNLTTTSYGFFNYLGSLTDRVTKLFVKNIDASGNVNAANYTLNGTTIQDWSDISSEISGIVPVYLENNLNSINNSVYTNIFNITLTPNKINVIHVYLAQSSSATGGAIQNRAILNESGPVGYCHFEDQTGAGTAGISNIAVITSSSDTATTAMAFDVNVPFINIIACTILSDSNQRNLIIQFQPEIASNVTTYAGSYYTNAVN